jgi:hypothetical protein
MASGPDGADPKDDGASREKRAGESRNPDGAAAGKAGPQGPSLRGRLARRIFRELDEELSPEDRTIRGEAREVLGAMLETGDRARVEVYRLMARELRSYLDALQVGDALSHLMTNYSLEVNASFSLKPLAPKKSAAPDKAPGGEKPADAERRRAPDAAVSQDPDDDDDD